MLMGEQSHLSCAPGAYVGRPRARVEDADLVSGRGRFGDDLPVRTATLHAAILRSPHAHAELLSVDIDAASAVPGVAAIVTGEDAKRWTRPFTAAIKAPVEHWCLAVDRVRYVGEPVAVVLAGDRYAAADALEQIEVSYRPLPAVIDPVAAAESAAPLLHTALGMQRHQRPLVSLRRSRSRIYCRCPPDHAHDHLPAQLRHPDRVLCGDRRISAR